jgi:chemotaxis protein methyltransferase CheR
MALTLTLCHKSFKFINIITIWQIMISASHLKIISKVLKTHSGYVFSEDKSYLVESKLPPILKILNYQNIDDFISDIDRNPFGKAANQLCQAMTINETSFFRDQSPYINLEKYILPALAQGTPRTLRVWSAACSSGQEPYSIAMTWEENKHLYPQWSLEIYATDLSMDMIALAQKGEYTNFEVSRGLTEEKRNKYFTKLDNGWRIMPEISSMVQFEPMNLLQIKPQIGLFDVIFCRNVLIYFDQDQKFSIIQDLRRHCATNGYLITGASEIITKSSLGFARSENGLPFYKAI